MPISHLLLPTVSLEYYESEVEDVEKPCLVILSANPSDFRDYDMIKPKLETLFHVIILQWPGFGGSKLEKDDATDDGALYFFQILLQFLENMKITKANYMGVDVGAYVTCKLAIEYPQLVNKIVLVNPCGFSPTKLLGQHYATLMSGRFAPNPLTAAKSYLGHKEKPIIASILNRAATVHSTPIAQTVIRNVWKSLLLPETELSDRGAAVRSQVLLVFGDHSPIVSPLKEGKTAKKAFGNSDAGLIILDSRHLPFAEVPDEFLKSILPFLASNDM
jgi:pimeloyl-ACP methyl ester carboxylesterase